MQGVHSTFASNFPGAQFGLLWEEITVACRECITPVLATLSPVPVTLRTATL